MKKLFAVIFTALLLCSCSGQPQNADITTSGEKTTTTTVETTSMPTESESESENESLVFVNDEGEVLYNLLVSKMDEWEHDYMYGGTLLDLDFDGEPEFLLFHGNYTRTLSVFKINDNSFKEFFTLPMVYRPFVISLYTDENNNKSWMLDYKYTDENVSENRFSSFTFKNDEVSEFIKFCESTPVENVDDFFTNGTYYIDEKEFRASEDEIAEYEKEKKEYIESGMEGLIPRVDPTWLKWINEKALSFAYNLNPTAYELVPNEKDREWFYYNKEEIKESLATLVNAYFSNDEEYLMNKNAYTNELAIAKPVIYLYPNTETDVTVTIDLDGELTCTYPEYNNGWNVTAYPDGTLINKADGREYSYLYWEGKSNIEWDFSSGFVVKGSDTVSFLQEKLEYLGLNPREYNEFIVYWLPLMQNNTYNLITFQTNEYEEIAKLNISPKPDNILRVFMTYKPLVDYIEIPEQKLNTFERTGFSVIEWGGTCVK